MDHLADYHSKYPMLTVGELIRTPDGRAFVVGFVNQSRARLWPLTSTEREITVHERGKITKTTKVITETGDPIDISPNPVIPRLDVGDLTDAEFLRLNNHVLNGGEFNG